ncbi:C45 family peptidase [Myroides odoratimimus]|uniref:C45 family peptidase n=1 Tax=Myroides odoratimimus TaxID=76832 RepID=UPI002577799D|nr:C45 family peptidase [Myroides odoratimimus]MDM1092192.1 acyl-CoA--6-aminopenicillanic acid acyl-transferase [Myroides odoratimimus]MDM1325790.1 acyl-CoA--6-aminopenicillanic acid acyl-transferase [Myroides odoratimimus]MDM1400202.1 acyl-CoA--6-aminopenicillanic acid acyl-transferase [Myroides odoratimimus]MDM1409972.1 acyl-CoA--6-aminopenicillanic acid acyl-transferase [Myroides odoratimimus]MDM1453852.1 acyl-CoA--6-aminopenicillanic acid acyl-transferase [Myroides odoratimimus]
MKHWYRYIGTLIICALLGSCGVKKGLKDVPILEGWDAATPEVSIIQDSIRITDKGFLSKNKQQLWELYVSGDPYQIGLNTGALTKDLYQKQETIFFSKVEEFVPAGFKQKMLIKLLKYYNRDLYQYIPNEYKAEIYGLSNYATTRFDFLGPAYQRNLYLHGAHDIGHAFQDLALVGCTSLAVWDENSADGGLLIGRNFDFYVGDDFAENKIIAFIQPDKGNAFMSVTWGGMTGVVSGMNEKGLTVTLNAGKSSIPLKAKTPISVVAREILQYADNIEQAIAIAKTKKVFVSESIMVGSAADRKAILIEIAPKNFGVYDVVNSSALICSNHFQSDAFKKDKRNTKQIEESHSQYRWDKVNEYVHNTEVLTPQKMVEILRDTKGLNGKEIGYGNEKALNQLLAHHGIVFQPEKRLVWVSSNPYQLGEFVAYDLNEIFSKENRGYHLGIDSLTIAKDQFIDSNAFKDYERFRVEDQVFQQVIKDKEKVSEEYIKTYQALNPEYWLVYYRTALYYMQKKQYSLAREEFNTALTKEVTTLPAEQKIKKYLKKIRNK